MDRRAQGEPVCRVLPNMAVISRSSLESCSNFQPWRPRSVRQSSTLAHCPAGARKTRISVARSHAAGYGLGARGGGDVDVIGILPASNAQGPKSLLDRTARSKTSEMQRTPARRARSGSGTGSGRKPSSVPPRKRRDGHLSGTVVANRLEQPTRGCPPPRRSGMTGGRCGPHLAAYLALLRLGVAVPSLLPATRWALTPPFHPYLALARGAVCFLLPCPSPRGAQALPGSLPSGARTFLAGGTCVPPARPPHPTRSVVPRKYTQPSRPSLTPCRPPGPAPAGPGQRREPGCGRPSRTRRVPPRIRGGRRPLGPAFPVPRHEAGAPAP